MSQEELVYDPKTKQMIKDTLYQHLYGPVQEHYQKRLDTIIQTNSKLHGNSQRRLRYQETVYEMTNPGDVVRPINMVHPDVKPQMKEYIEDLTKLNSRELPYVLGFINQVLNSSNSLQDYFKVFPESVHQPIRELVDRCSCRGEFLKPETVERLKARHQVSIDLMKTRMVKNLLL